MQHRGRSRHISPVALARQASEERRRSRIPLITDTQSGIPLPLPSTPAPPPQSLEDQIQVAYALDDIRLAKILLLKLKGILVTDDSDPRIDHVRDEDFDMCFAPSGPLTLDEADKRALQETQRKQRQWWHESQRAQRLRACEKLWEDEMNRLHAEKGRALQRREHDLEQERARLAERTTQQRGIKSRLETSLPTKRDQDPFQYPFMLPSKPSSTLPCKSSKKTLTRSPGRHNRSVSFKEVINAMNGQLFPPDASERVDDARRTAGLPIPCPAPHRRKASMRAELLDSLLHVVEWQQGERRKAKGKDVVCEQQPLKSQLSPPDPMPLVPSSLSVTSLSSSTSSSRSGSWLTFGSWRSTATDITTPDSPVSSPTSTQPCLPTLIETQRELHPHCAFVRISLSDTPLCLPTTSHHTVLEDGGPHAMPSGSAMESFPSLNMRGALVEHVTRSVATIIEAAKGLQSAYITATMFTAGSPYVDRVTPSQPHVSLRCQRPPRREGYRALAKDVHTFTDSITSISQLSEPVHFIPLVSQPSGTAALPKPSVPKNALIFPSPLRPRTPPAVLAYRMRPVANPAVLRIRALQNLMCARGKEWEGRGREGGLGCGKERMLGVAFEGRGRSGLGCEVRFVVA
ncbi:hypothetical protein L210DRAFT_840423 [Boletus edulis BED1]|uniref:Uncharacterized protein n=1 Tax=Boletus edulis BED1 TaxID=1328754 RepID=A0AAD4BKG4_BOLED|nr:hypothetical protein L210DRAFT_840423 [Boletus edulis BED1]